MVFDPFIAVRRFGAGPSPLYGAPTDAAALLGEAAAPDPFAASHPFTTGAEAFATAQSYLEARGRARRRSGSEEGNAARQEMRALTQAARLREDGDLRALLVRHVGQPFGLGERLVSFWTDHFTARGLGGVQQFAGPAYAADAIRPHVMGRFADMARAVLREPVMLLYLDQARSSGPNSRVAKRREGRGLNENLARELLELHTLGVDGRYTQGDVFELAKLLAGLSTGPRAPFLFRRNLIEPGAEEVLGQRYAGDDLAAVDAAIEDLARHPDTARHLARKLATHFVADAPDAALITHVAARYSASDGDLGETTAALLEHPAAWDAAAGNVKWPLDYLTSSLRALGLSVDAVAAFGPRDLRRHFRAPLGRMGQPWHRPPDPAGWEEADAYWVTPQAVAERVNWAMQVPGRLLNGALPDARALLALVAADRGTPELTFAVSASENQREGVGLVLASPTFQRR